MTCKYVVLAKKLSKKSSNEAIHTSAKMGVHDLLVRPILLMKSLRNT